MADATTTKTKDNFNELQRLQKRVIDAPEQNAFSLTRKMLARYPRQLELPRRSFFLFGAWGTGKTTWLREKLADAKWFDLVRDREVVRLTRDEDAFRNEVEALPSGHWVVVDEVQRLPAILNEVQDILSRKPGAYQFALTGSSARKLRRGGANLLPARVVNRHFYPLTSSEMGFPADVDELLRFGCLPAVHAAETEGERVDLLEAYVENYITQEVRLEALVKRLDSFLRFLEVAALANGQVTNVSGISRDAGVARPTVQGYFETLVDTLLGTWVPALRRSAKVKEVAHPKFYFFDPGVIRAVAGRLREPLDQVERGHLLETLVLHELRAHVHLSNIGGDISYWRTPSGSEVDFVWERGGEAVGIEVKAAHRWRHEFGRPLRDLQAAGVVKSTIGVYLGEHPLREDKVDVYPWSAFVRALHAGAILPAPQRHG